MILSLITYSLSPKIKIITVYSNVSKLPTPSSYILSIYILYCLKEVNYATSLTQFCVTKKPNVYLS